MFWNRQLPAAPLVIFWRPAPAPAPWRTQAVGGTPGGQTIYGRPPNP